MHITDAIQVVSMIQMTAPRTNNPSAEPTSPACGCDTPMNTFWGNRNLTFTPL